MLPYINGKPLFECTEEDLSVVIDNSDYRENDYLEYKSEFTFLNYPKADPKRKKYLAEFRSDVCALANAEGGYIVYGIRDVNGMALEIIGIDIPEENTDKFELDRKNNLSSILPKIPPVQFRFLRLNTGKYIVIIHVKADSFVPYIHVENEIDYRIFKRVGNGKRSVGYVELKNMFNQSLSIEKEVQLYRQDRINYYRSLEDTPDRKYSMFMLLHIIPDTFMDSHYNYPIFLAERQKKIRLSEIFTSVSCGGYSTPNVDGLRFPSYNEEAECQINNTGVAEVFFPLSGVLTIDEKYPSGFFASTYVWERIAPVVENYIAKMKQILHTKRFFVCLSIMGCKGIVTEDSWERVYRGKIDRNTVICAPVVFENIDIEDRNDISLKLFQIEFALALGIKNSKVLQKLISEVYQ